MIFLHSLAGHKQFWGLQELITNLTSLSVMLWVILWLKIANEYAIKSKSILTFRGAKIHVIVDIHCINMLANCPQNKFPEVQKAGKGFIQPEPKRGV